MIWWWIIMFSIWSFRNLWLKKGVTWTHLIYIYIYIYIASLGGSIEFSYFPNSGINLQGLHCCRLNSSLSTNHFRWGLNFNFIKTRDKDNGDSRNFSKGVLGWACSVTIFFFFRFSVTIFFFLDFSSIFFLAFSFCLKAMLWISFWTLFQFV